jgi:hypothetical protein
MYKTSAVIDRSIDRVCVCVVRLTAHAGWWGDDVNPRTHSHTHMYAQGASASDVAVLVVSAVPGEFENSMGAGPFVGGA